MTPIVDGISGNTALVTGAAQGIGRAIAVALAQAGASVGIMDLQKAKAEVVADEIRRANRWAVAIAGDVTAPVDHSAALAALDAAPAGPVTILVNNAGIQRSAPFLETNASDLETLIEVHLRGAFLLTQAVARRWAISGVRGRVVNIASIAGTVQFPGFGAYSIAKSAVRGMTGALALELAPLGIRVNAVAPGYIDTEMDSTRSDPAARARRVATIPRGRMGTPADIAAAVMFLASEAAAYITGHTITVDGGFTLQ
jgi:glucose 1-dehydrogenase